MLRLFALPVACSCVSLGVVAQSLKPVKRLAACKRTQQLPTLLAQQCWELLRPFARRFRALHRYRRGQGSKPGMPVLFQYAFFSQLHELRI